MIKQTNSFSGGFAIVALAGIVAMLVSIFSSPKQIAEEIIETPTPPQTEPATRKTASPVDEITLPDGSVAFYLDENGNKVWIPAEDTARSDALEAELKQQEEEQKALDEAEKKWWESRKDSIERFPFEPFHPLEIIFDKDAG